MRYHVFLSFRGSDTRKTFTDHLYAALERKGIVTFRDDLEIENGDAISEQLRKAIQQSRYFIIVLSKDFASSAWCLNELQEIMATDRVEAVFPVFYDVKPGYIGNDRGEKLKRHEGRYSTEQIARWNVTLRKVAKIKGWLSQDKGEAKLVEEIATRIWSKLCDELPSNFEYLVGDMPLKAERIITHLRMGLDDKRFIGIWGMGGIGKTTLSRVIYDNAKKKGEFDASCFLANIRENSEKFGLVHLQKKLLSNLQLREPNYVSDHFHGAGIIRHFLSDKKVLIVLDDVNHRSQLDSLARKEEWFGAGSKIIITTRDKHLLTQYNKSYAFKVDMLCDAESLELLCQKAFKKNPPGEDFINLLNKVVQYAGGHPMALEVLGSFLCTRKQCEWRRTIDRLRQGLPKEIFSQLRISYDELEGKYKTIFLHIACFFNKEAEFKVANILNSCGLDEIVGIKVLAEKSLLCSSRSNLESRQNAREQHQNMHDRLQKMKVNTEIEARLYKALDKEASKEYLFMHDLLQEMGRNIVFEESPTAGRRSRLWSLEDIDLVLKLNEGTKHVQGIVLEKQRRIVKADWDPNCFSKMINLRLLDLSKVHILRKLESLPSSLKFLRWDDYAQDCLPSIEKLCNLESLQLCNTNIQKLWEGNPVLNKLRIIDMSGSESLSETPDFSGTPNLEELLLNRCRKLVRVHESVGQLKKLVKLSLKKCKRLEFLPTKLEMNNLQEFILVGCEGLENLPNFGEEMESLYFINVSHTGITQIPSSIKYLINLKILDLWNCDELKSLPPDLPPHLIVCASNSPKLKYTIVQLINLSTSRVPKDTSGEFVTITADTSDVAADSNEECWGIAICLYLKSLSQEWRSYIIWSFQDQRETHLSNKMNGILTPDDDDGWGIYVGFYPFGEEQCRRNPTNGEPTQLDFTLSFLTTSTDRDLRDLAIMGCGWRLTSKLDFDKWWENRALSPSGHGSRDRDEGESSRSAAERKGKKKIQEIQ
ncbi:hypothetical protein K1719_020718 [Acacia pycnantha]|nr:hypothetical protein K1719_020718 [Acacia pycnantha]